MLKKLVLSAALAASMIGTSARADEVRSDDPASLVRVMQNMGYRAELTKDNSGDPMIRSTASGSDFAILFYGCKSNRNCTTVQFFAGFKDPDNGSLSAINKWNNDNRFGRAYQAESGSARIEYDLDLDMGGMSAALFQDNLEVFISLVDRYRKYVYNRK
ncbi:YbjN domain-containing protein [Novosphingobium bradum]|uniref:YbjN domain-containing protein n=1 Tax=Novosphingobium bradum TaxID=1737444 RepID=A0ABV7IUC7_9SPHN